MENLTAFVLAAGLGTRLRPLTDSIPKALIEINKKTMLQRLIEKLASIKIKNLIINTHHHAGQITDFLSKNNFGMNIHISDESNLLLDTGGGLKKAAELILSEYVLIHNVDIYSSTNLLNVYNLIKENDYDGLLVVQKRKSNRHLLFNKNKELIGWENISTNERILTSESIDEISEYAFSGISILNKRIFKYFPAKQKFSLIEFLLKASEKSKIILYDDSHSDFYDIGTVEKLNHLRNNLNYTH